MIYGTTGHRDLRRIDAVKIADKFVNMMNKDDILIVGGAKGWDYLITERAIEKGIKLWLYVPWRAHDIERFRHHAEIIKISNIGKGTYHIANFFIRNQWIVDDCGILFAYWDGKEKGGTWDTVRRAQKKNVKMRVLHTPQIVLFDFWNNKIDDAWNDFKGEWNV